MVGAAAATSAVHAMSWEQFLELPGDARAEYVDGKALVNPPPTYGHQKVCLRLRDILTAQLGAAATVAVAVGWLFPGDRPRLRIPDLMVLDSEPAGDLVTEAPPVVVEVLSTNRVDDLVRKSTEYLDAGAAQYWIIDPRDRVMDVFRRTAGGWDRAAHLSDHAPEATVATPPFGDIALSLTDILG